MDTRDSAADRTRRRDEFSFARQQMVEHQLRRRGIGDPRVLQAMLSVPREEFVAAGMRDFAYEDSPLPIGFGQTISQPYTVAFQCEALQLKGDERVLEVGTGSGYAAAVLSRLAKVVFTIERLPDLAAHAELTLRRVGYNNVHVFTADGTLGLPRHAPFDAIVVTAAGSSLPQPYVDQLAPGGRVVIPLGDTLGSQSMFRFTKLADELKVENLGGFVFVPLVGRYGWEHAARS